ncbi:four helix bundle protein [Candidatus Uhrbacteria bacterium]|nr:four helix bundle protein [Candidatus Uhrbacteria bacterium]
MNHHPIRSFRDLDVYQSTYRASVTIALQVLPKLPPEERFDLRDQLSRSSKAIPRLIAEGFAKKHQRLGFQKYLDDAMAECNETIVGIEHCKDIYHVDAVLCDQLIDDYDKAARQLFKLAEAWDTFKNRRRTTTPYDDTGRDAVKRTTPPQ